MSKSIAVLGSDQVPLAYTVPVPGTLTPLTAAATFDGSGAGAFLPCVSFYDSDGNLISRATAPEVAAGGTAEVSWFPSVGGATAASGLTGVTGLYTFATTSIGAGAVGYFSLQFANGVAVLDLTDPTTPVFATDGIYTVAASVVGAGTASALNEWRLDVLANFPFASDTHMYQDVASATLSRAMSAAVTWTVGSPPATSFRVSAWNHDSAARGFQCNNILVTRVT